MSVVHPIVAVTGSSGAGTSTLKQAFAAIFRRDGVKSVMIDGDSFHRYDRKQMQAEVIKAEEKGQLLTHFGSKANCLSRLELLLQTYAATGKGEKRHYIHDEAAGTKFHQAPGTFTPWQTFADDSDLLFYSGLHGGIVTEQVNIAQYVDLLIGVVPVINLEWIQKINRDCSNRGYSPEEVVDNILKRMPDYAHYITPQFSRTHINFQRVPLIDTSNPFEARDVPTPEQSLVVICFNGLVKADLSHYLSRLQNSFLSGANSIVVPEVEMELAMEIILTPLIDDMMVKKRQRG
ncbi:MAG: phosphoribulokinase [Methylophaga sp.]|nr:MAG: phosphoribulokinase [Methylophaga sp.]